MSLFRCFSMLDVSISAYSVIYNAIYPIKTTIVKWNPKDCTFKPLFPIYLKTKSPNTSLMTMHSRCVWSPESYFLYGLCILNSTNVSYNATNKKTSTRNALSFYCTIWHFTRQWYWQMKLCNHFGFLCCISQCENSLISACYQERNKQAFTLFSINLSLFFIIKVLSQLMPRKNTLNQIRQKEHKQSYKYI